MPDPTPDTPLVLPSSRGPIPARFRDCSPARASVLTVGGFDGGFHGPGPNLYDDLAADLPALGLAVLRLDFRVKTAPGPIEDGTHDVVAGIDWLAGRGRAPVILVGHSYGGAVVVRAAVRRRSSVAGVIALSTQTAGMEEVAHLAPIPLLLIHGTADRRLPARLSEWVYARAGEPKTLYLLEGASHSLRQQRDTLSRLVRDWILATAPPALDA